MTSLLGADAPLLTDGEVVESHELFSKLMSKKTLTGEDEGVESELKYLQTIKEVRDSDPDLFEAIKKLPKKARTGRSSDEKMHKLLTYFRKGKLHKFFMATKQDEAQELDFLAAAAILEATASEKRKKLDDDFYKLLEKNKDAFTFATTDEMEESGRGGRDTESQALKLLKLKEFRRYKGFTEDDEEYVEQVIRAIEEGWLPKETAKKLHRQLKEQLGDGVNPLQMLGVVKKLVPNSLLKEPLSDTAALTGGPKEVVLSEYFVSD